MINGTIINYYFHCKRQCWLHANRVNLEDNSEDVLIGKVLHKLKYENDKSAEISFEGIKVDKITKDYVVETKKSDADPQAVKWQVLLYLKTLKDKGIIKKGKIEYIEKRNKNNQKIEYIELSDELEKELISTLDEIEKFINLETPPKEILESKCKKCAYYEYCFI